LVRSRRERPVETVGPAVIGTGETRDALAATLRDARSTVAADIQVGAERVVRATYHQDRHTRKIMCHVVAGTGKQASKADVDRYAAKERLALQRGLIGAGVVGDRVTIDIVGQRSRARLDVRQQLAGFCDLILMAHDLPLRRAPPSA